MLASTVFVSTLLALAPLADASLQHGSARFSRHNHQARSIARRASNNTGSSGKCPKRSHPPTSTSLNATSIPTASATVASSEAEFTIATTTSAAVQASASAGKVNAASVKSSAASSAPAASPSTPSSSESGTLSGLLGSLFPVSTSNAWTMASGLGGGVDTTKLSTSALAITSEIKALSNPIGTFQGKTAMEASFPAGCWGLEKDVLGGMSWYGAGQTSRSDWNNAKELTFGYSVYFDEGFDWNKGGKMPGVYIGTSESQARGCSGGDRDTECASVRMMWRTDGMGEFYTYLPSPDTSSKFAANKALCDVAPQSLCNDQYGASVGRGAFSFTSGEWNDVAMRVLINDAGKANGEIELFHNGESKISVQGLIIADSSDVRPQGIMAQSFFGGSDSSWASSKDQSIHYADFSVAITKTF